MPAMLILLTSMSTLALLSKAMIAIPSLSLMLSSKTTSSGKRTLRLPGFCRAKTLALRDMALAYVVPCGGQLCRLWILKCLSFRLSQWLHDHLIAFFTICVRRPATEVCGSLSNLCSTGRWVGVGFERALGVVEGPESLRASAARRGCLDLGCPWCTGAVSHLSMAAGQRPAVHPSAPQDMAGAAAPALST